MNNNHYIHAVNAMQMMAQHLQNQARLFLLWQRIRRRRRRIELRSPRLLWSHQWLLRRDELGFFSNLVNELRDEDPLAYKTFMRCGPDVFNELCRRLHPWLLRKPSNYRKPLSPELMVAITLRFLASGSDYRSLAFGFRVASNTISGVVKEVCHAIVGELEEELLSTPNTEDAWREVATQFSTKWNFHNSIGAMDGKHVAIKRPPGTYQEYYNYKKFYSIILFAIVDADLKFIYVDIGSPGSVGDAGIWNRSQIKQAIEQNTLNIPPDTPLPGDNEPMPYFIIGDDAFSLTTRLMKPYGHRGLTYEEKIFNYRLSRARRVVENAFGIMANRFRVLTRTLPHKPETAALITHACCVLHNLLRARNPVAHADLVDREDANHNLIPGAWRAGVNMHEVEDHALRGRINVQAKTQRALLKLYYNSIGAVDWQQDKVLTF